MTRLQLRLQHCASRAMPKAPPPVSGTWPTTVEWFVIILIGFVIRCDHLDLTSIVRWLFLTPESYDLILHFFRATSWQLEPLLSQWAQIAFKRDPTITFAGRSLMLADGVKLGKETRRMPAIKTLHQDSDNASKAP